MSARERSTCKLWRFELAEEIFYAREGKKCGSIRVTSLLNRSALLQADAVLCLGRMNSGLCYIRRSRVGTRANILPSDQLLLARDDHFDLGDDFAVQFGGHFVFSQRLDGLVELDLALVERETLRGKTVGDVRRGHRPEHLVVLSRFALQRHGDRGEKIGLALRAFALGGLALGQRPLDLLHLLEVARGDRHGL